jgi:hypothetical protein
MTLTIRPARVADASSIMLRPSDLHEGNLWVPGYSAEQVLASSIEHADYARTAEADGRVVAVFGYTADDNEVSPWLMCAPEARLHAKVMLRLAKRVLAHVRALYPQHLVCNHLHRPNAEARAFITHLGFRVVPSPGRAEFDFFYLPPCASP